MEFNSFTRSVTETHRKPCTCVRACIDLILIRRDVLSINRHNIYVAVILVDLVPIPWCHLGTQLPSMPNKNDDHDSSKYNAYIRYKNCSNKAIVVNL